jgi:hypothetical protein
MTKEHSYKLQPVVIGNPSRRNIHMNNNKKLWLSSGLGTSISFWTCFHAIKIVEINIKIVAIIHHYTEIIGIHVGVWRAYTQKNIWLQNH